MVVVPQKIRHKTCQGQQRLSGGYSRQTSLTHERHALGDAHVDETNKGWFIAWIDRSSKALEKQEASLKKERATMNDEQRERLLIAEQIERAEREAREKAHPRRVPSRGKKASRRKGYNARRSRRRSRFNSFQGLPSPHLQRHRLRGSNSNCSSQPSTRSRRTRLNEQIH